MKKPKVLGNYTYATVGGGFTDAAMYLGQATPSHYPEVDLNKIKPRVLSTKIQPFKGDKDAQYKFKKNDSPSPHSYKNAEAYMNTQITKINYSISKTKNQNFAEVDSNRKKFVPGVGKYDVTKADKKITLGAARGWK